MTDTIVYRREGRVGRLILNIPERHNSLGREQLLAIQQHLAAVANDRQVRVLVLTGAGDRTFCAGASLQELGAGEIGGDCFRATATQLAGPPAELILATDTGAPLLARRPLGRGSTLAWTSDLKARWATDSAPFRSVSGSR